MTTVGAGISLWPRGASRDEYRAVAAALPILGGKQQRRERLESGHELVELTRLEALVGLRREVVGERLDPLSDGAALLAEPPVITDQAAIAHSVGYGSELRWPQVVDASELLRDHAHVQGEQDVSLEAADPLDHQGRDMSVPTVLAQQGAGKGMTPIGSTSSNIRRAIEFMVRSSCHGPEPLADVHDQLDGWARPASSRVPGWLEMCLVTPVARSR